MTDLTRPELSVDRRICKELLKDACRICVHRIEAWELVGCTVQDRTYPACTKDDRAPAFDPDLAEIERRRAA